MTVEPIMRTTSVLLAAILAGACGTDDPAPIATVMSATPEALTPSDDRLDDLTITVAYDDADGDLGDGLAQVYDCRADGLVTELIIPAIAPDHVIGTHITGTLELHVNDVGAVTASTLPAACDDLGVAALSANASVFCVILIDAAEHVGPGDCTQEISLAP
jgi:hypothetical protein